MNASIPIGHTTASTPTLTASAQRFREKEKTTKAERCACRVDRTNSIQNVGRVVLGCVQRSYYPLTYFIVVFVFFSVSNNDQELCKVGKVLEGKAIVTIADVEPLALSSSSSLSSLTAGMVAMNAGSHTHDENKKASERKCLCTEILGVT